LKELGEKAEINEPIEIIATKGGKRIREVYKKYELITVHTARRSFATNAYLLVCLQWRLCCLQVIRQRKVSKSISNLAKRKTLVSISITPSFLKFIK
jgi:hypothetical protein